MPNGTANNVVMIVNMKVPTTAGNMPPSVMPFLGKSKIKFNEIVDQPFEKISYKIMAKKKQTKAALAENKIQLNRFIIFIFICNRYAV